MENLFVQSIILVFSLFLLIYFSDKLIDASVKLAKAYGISDTVIGLTLLAYGTSMPELTVSSISSAGLHPELSISNVIGSNIANIALIIGLAAFVSPFSINEKQLVKRDNFSMVASTLLLVSLFVFFGGIGHIVGIVMIMFVIGYTYYTIKHDITLKLRKDSAVSKLKETGMVLFCLMIVVLSGKLAVDSAVSVADGLGISEWVIGATVIAIGTSLPELAVSLTAAKKGFFGMSLGNIVGSNIFNILWVLGFAASITTLSIDFSLIKIDSLVLVAVTLMFSYHMVKGTFSRIKGIIYILVYVVYVAYLLAF